MERKRNDEYIKGQVHKIQNLANGEEKEFAIYEILTIFEPFRKALVKRFGNRGVSFDDVCQQVDLKMIEAIHDYDESKDPSAIRHITSRARNGIWNYYRKEMDYFNEDRKLASLDGAVTFLESNGSPSELSRFDIWEVSDDSFNEDRIIEMIVVEQELKKLTEHQRNILEMHYMTDMTQGEIADELSIDQSNVSRAKKRGVASLKSYINPLDEQNGKQ